ncbi:MAG TPA: hypothetical protein VEY71_05850 [Chitinophagales bacterium]|nr:hypothetical protein [Chitinophagales bacterium]
MKPFLTVVCLLAFSFSIKAQFSPQASVCGPEYSVNEFEAALVWPYGPANSAAMFSDAGILYNNGVQFWYAWFDTAHVFFLDQGGYTHQIIPGSGDTSLFGLNLIDSTGLGWFNYHNMSQVFWHNNNLYLADYSGIRQAGSGQYWSYPDSIYRNILGVQELNGAIWLIASEIFADSSVSVVKFDGAATESFDAPFSHYSYSGVSSFVYGNELYLNIGDELQSFNTVTETFGTFDYAVYPNLDLTPLEYGLNTDGNIVAVGFANAPLDEGLLMQELTGSTWEVGTYLFTPWFMYDSSFSILFAEEFPVLRYPDFGETYVLDTVHVTSSGYGTHSYASVDTLYGFAMGWRASGLSAHDPEGNLYLYNPDVVMGMEICGNPFALYHKIFRGYFTGTGNAFVDLNTNGVLDGTDYPLANSGVCNAVTACSVTDDNGDFSIYLDSANNVITPAAYTNYTTQPASYTLNGVQSDQSGLTFAYQPISTITDLAVTTVYSTQPPRPGFTFNYVVKVANHGTTPTSDTIVLTLNEDFVINNVTPAPLYQTATSVAWVTGNLNPLVLASFNANVTLSTSITIGTEIESTTSLGTGSDDNPANDAYTLSQTVQGSFDPNDKAANPIFWVQDGEEIQYTIRFQNTGTDTAFNVVVRDTLDANLEWSTFQLQHTSHPVSVNLNLQNGAVAFYFNNILLADSNVNEPASHGIFVYAIKTKNALVDGTTINNTASIYFDYNLPVVTNTTLNVIGEPLAVTNVYANAPTLIPNPASVRVTAVHHAANGSHYGITDVLGRNVLSTPASHNGSTTISLESLKPGAYVVTLFDVDGNAAGYARLVVMR